MIFPDSDDEGVSKRRPFPPSPAAGSEESELTWRLKSAPVDSLTHFMATVLCNVKDMHGKVFCIVVKLYHLIEL